MLYTLLKHKVERNDVVMDFIEFEIRTTSKTQAWRIKYAMRGLLPYVTGHNEITGIAFEGSEANTPTTMFRFRIQNPENFRHVKTILEQVKMLNEVIPKFALKESPELTAIEIAFDTYCKGSDKRELAEIAAERYRFLTCQPARDWHFYRKKRETPRYLDGRNRKHIGDKLSPREIIESTCDSWILVTDEDGEYVNNGEMFWKEIVIHFINDWQLTDTSDKSAAKRIHGYVKTSDGKDSRGNPKPLPKDEWRARIEVTLRGAELPCKTLDELERIDFVKLATKFFNFRQLADDLHPAAKYALHRHSGKQLGVSGVYRRKHKNIIGEYRNTGATKFSSSTQADSLNKEINEMLRTLTRQWKSKYNLSKTKPSADFSEDVVKQTRIDAGNNDDVLIIGLSNTNTELANHYKHNNESYSFRTNSEKKHKNNLMTEEMLSLSRLMEINDED